MSVLHRPAAATESDPPVDRLGLAERLDPSVWAFDIAAWAFQLARFMRHPRTHNTARPATSMTLHWHDT